MEATDDERDLLDQLVDDGWPLVVLAPGGGEDRRTALSLLRKGLAEVYGEPDHAVASPEDAEAIVADEKSWDPTNANVRWMIRATAAGHELLAEGPP